MGHTQSQGFTPLSTGTSVTVTLTADVPAGHTIVGFLATDATSGVLSAITGVSDSAGNTWTLPGATDAEEPQVNAGTTVATQAFSSRLNQPMSAGATITVTLAAARVRWAVALEVNDDIATGTRMDVKGVATGSSTALAVTTSPLPTTVDLVRVYAAFAFGSGRTPTIPVGWTGSTKVETAVGSADRGLQVIWRDVAATGVQAASLTLSSSSTYSAVIACYRLAGAEGARLEYSGTTADLAVAQAVVENTDGDNINVAQLAGGVVLTAWNQASGGIQQTDLVSDTGSPITTVTTEADGTIPVFEGPSLYTNDLWLQDPESGRRFRIAPAGLSTRVAAVEAELGAGGAIARLDENQTFTGAQSITAPKTQIGLRIYRDQEVISTDEDTLQILFLGQRSAWFNEWGAHRIRIPNTHQAEAALKIQGNSDPNGYIWVVGDVSDINVLNFWLRVDGRLKVGIIDSPTTNRSSWTAVTVDSTTTPSKYVTHSPANGTDQDGFQVRLVDGGEAAELCGRINITGNAVVGDVIASALPILGSFSGASNVNTRPARNRIVNAALGTGGTAKVAINADGTVKSLQALTAPGSYTFDGCLYRRT